MAVISGLRLSSLSGTELNLTDNKENNNSNNNSSSIFGSNKNNNDNNNNINNNNNQSSSNNNRNNQPSVQLPSRRFLSQQRPSSHFFPNLIQKAPNLSLSNHISSLFEVPTFFALSGRDCAFCLQGFRVF